MYTPSTHATMAMMDSFTSGTGDLTLTSKVGYSTFSNSGVMTYDFIAYVIKDANGEWEVGRGLYNNTGPTLQRLYVVHSSNAGAKINCSGVATVHIAESGFDVHDGAVKKPMFGYYLGQYLSNAVGFTVTVGGTTPNGFLDPTYGHCFKVQTANTVGATASQSGFRTNQPVAKYSTGVMNSGYYIKSRGALSHASDLWIFVGVSNGNWTSTSGNTDSFASHSAGFWYRPTPSALAHTSWRFVTGAGGALDAQDTGVSVVAGRFYDLFFYVAPGGTDFYWRIKDMTTGTITTGSKNTVLPTSSTLLYPQTALGNQTAGTTRQWYQKWFEFVVLDDETP